MPWRSATLAQILGPANAMVAAALAAAELALAKAQLVLALLQAALSAILDQINKILRIVEILEATGAYVIVLSGAKGSWNSRMRLAPNAPPEGTDWCTTGVALVAVGPDLAGNIAAFKQAMDTVNKGIKELFIKRDQNLPPQIAPKPPQPPPQFNVWYSMTLGDMFPGYFALAKNVLNTAKGFIGNLKHDIANASNVINSANGVLSSIASFMSDLNQTGAYGIVLPPKALGIMQRLETEANAPPMTSQFYSIGLCFCFYYPNWKACDDKYASLCQIFDPNPKEITISRPSDPFRPTDIFEIEIPIKSWAVPKGGYYDKQVSVQLKCNVANATIFYTINAEKPRTNPFRRIYSDPILVTKNNTVIRFYAKTYLQEEKRDREEVYKIIEYAPNANYYYDLNYGLLPGFPVDEPPDWWLGKTLNECIQARHQDATDLVLDPGNATRDIDTCPEYYNPVIPDDPTLKDLKIVAKVQDSQAGTTTPNNHALTACDAYVDSGGLSGWAESSLIASFGFGPWGAYSAFPDPTAYWIWNEAGASTTALVNTFVVFKYWYNNTTGQDFTCNICFMCDNTAMLFSDNAYIVGTNPLTVGEKRLLDTDSGWDSISGTAKGSWETEYGYRNIEIIMPQGITEFSWIGTNWGGPAGLIFTCMDLSSGTVYFHSDATIKTIGASDDWYTNYIVNYVDKGYAINGSISQTVRPVVGEYFYIPVVLGDSKITEALTDLHGFEIQSNKKGLYGKVDDPYPFSITLLVDNSVHFTIIISPKNDLDTLS
jgi:hypothetical protein